MTDLKAGTTSISKKTPAPNHKLALYESQSDVATFEGRFQRNTDSGYPKSEVSKYNQVPGKIPL